MARLTSAELVAAKESILAAIEPREGAPEEADIRKVVSDLGTTDIDNLCSIYRPPFSDADKASILELFRFLNFESKLNFFCCLYVKELILLMLV